MHYWENGIDGAGGPAAVSGPYAVWAPAVVWAVRSARRPAAMDDRTQQAAFVAAGQILAARSARGEINRDEYRTMSEVLRRGSSS